MDARVTNNVRKTAIEMQTSRKICVGELTDCIQFVGYFPSLNTYYTRKIKERHLEFILKIKTFRPWSTVPSQYLLGLHRRIHVWY